MRICIFLLYYTHKTFHSVAYMGYKIKAVLSIILFATYPTLGKLAMDSNSPGVVNFIVESLSVLVLLLFFGTVTEARKYIRLTERHKIVPLLGMALGAGVLGPLFYLVGLEHASVLNAVLLLALQTPLTALMSVYILKEKISPSYYLSLAVLLFGMFVYSTNGFAHDLSFSWNDVYFVLSALSFACANIIYKKKLSHVPYDMVLLTRNALGALLMFFGLLVFSVEDLLRVSFDTHSLTVFALLACVPILAAQVLWYAALRHIRAVDGAIIDALYPLCTTLIAFVVLGEVFTVPQFFGGTLAGLGVILANMHVHGATIHRHQVELQHFKHH